MTRNDKLVTDLRERGLEAREEEGGIASAKVYRRERGKVLVDRQRKQRARHGNHELREPVKVKHAAHHAEIMARYVIESRARLAKAITEAPHAEHCELWLTIGDESVRRRKVLEPNRHLEHRDAHIDALLKNEGGDHARELEGDTHDSLVSVRDGVR